MLNVRQTVNSKTRRLLMPKLFVRRLLKTKLRLNVNSNLKMTRIKLKKQRKQRKIKIHSKN